MAKRLNLGITITTLCLCLASASSYAAPFGVAGQEPAEAAAMSRLISPNAVTNKTATPPPVVSEDQLTRTSGKPVTGDSLGGTGVSQQAFAQMIRNMMPLSPRQIETLHALFSDSQRAASTYPGIPPKPTSSSVMVNLSPGAAPPVIRLRAGYVTSLVFLDSTGEPWPIVAYDLGDPKAFNIEPNQPNGKSDTILVEALDTYKQGNLAVMLKGLNTPIMITLMPGQRAVDYRVDMRVPGLGPNAQPTLDGLPNTADPQLLTFLDGVPANGAEAVDVIGGPAQAWVYHDHLIVRTRMTILSPAWISTMSSPDGTHVFEMVETPVILASQRGAMVQLRIKGL